MFTEFSDKDFDGFLLPEDCTRIIIIQDCNWDILGKLEKVTKCKKLGV